MAVIADDQSRRLFDVVSRSDLIEPSLISFADEQRLARAIS